MTPRSDDTPLLNRGRSRRRASIAVVVAIIAAPVGAFLLGQQVSDQCGSVHKLVVTLDGMIANSRSQITKYEQEGLFTAAQADRARGEQAENRRRLAGADCE